MTIETKYNIGDEVWAKRKGQASEGIIVSITAFADCLLTAKMFHVMTMVGVTMNGKSIKKILRNWEEN